jgi:NAD(P)-dependent dehydrogenase (short-subunit alcohol dehydrogenase family)
MAKEVVLITGCSAGIGKATAERAVVRGHTLVATAPTLAEVAEVPTSAALRLRLDVTDAESVRRAVAEAREQVGPISALVNNAGICQPGPIELLSDEQVRRQLDVNVAGPIRVLREVLPDMRTAGRGTVVNIASVLGRVSLPLVGMYCASKHAVEALSDALRLELSPFGIRVVAVEPGWIRSKLRETAASLSDPAWIEAGPYAGMLRAAEANEGRLQRWEGTPEDVAGTIVAAFESERPKARYPVTFMARLLPALRLLLPTRWNDSMNAANLRA